MSDAGAAQLPYLRYPTIFGESIVFMAEDDLWAVSAEGGVARRLTAGMGSASRPRFSPDGRLIAYVGREEGEPEVYVMPAQGGDVRRVTYGYGPVVGVFWTPDQRIAFASAARQPFNQIVELFEVSPEGGEPSALPWGPAREVAFGPMRKLAIGRHGDEPAYWKRYRGGTVGQIWLDSTGSRDFRKLSVPGNLSRPMWVGSRLYFLSDHEGIGNLYSCAEDGTDVRRHTDHVEYYARAASTDGRRIVYHAGGDLYVFDPASDISQHVSVIRDSARTGRQRKFVDPGKYLDGYALHPKGHSLVLTTRGKAFTFGNWEGPVKQLGVTEGVRHRLAHFLSDGKAVVLVSDAGGEEALEVHDLEQPGSVRRFADLSLGRIEGLVVSPVRPEVAVANERHEIHLVDLKKGLARQLDVSEFGGAYGMDYSPDGEWLAYSLGISRKRAEIRLCRLSTGEVTPVTEPVLIDRSPSFDPTGTYLYFLGERVFDPVYDNLEFELSFPRGVRPYMVLLAQNTPSPFLPGPRPLTEETDATPAKRDDESAVAKDGGEGDPEHGRAATAIDLEGIQDRILALPVNEARYAAVSGLGGKALLLSDPVEGALHDNHWSEETDGKGVLEVYDLKELKLDSVVSGVSSYFLGLDRKTMVYRAGRRLRVVKAGTKPEDKDSEPSRKTGWVNLSRLRVSIDPPAEWSQMLREAWRLMRENFWTQDMSDVDWEKVYRRYAPLLDRASVRSEVSDVLWEMQAELGTSHAYEIGGDYRPSPPYGQGHLGADLAYDAASGGYRVTHIVRGDPWAEDEDSPLRTPGVNVTEGDVLTAIDGHELSASLSPNQLLVHRANAEVELTIARGVERRNVTVKTLASETNARYREWVNHNREHVHKLTGNRVGYVHVPDMMARGFAEFHRGFLPEALRAGLIVDVRFNRGGHVSQLLAEKLARRRLGYDLPRHGVPIPYPEDSVLGPIAALTNELAGSDGDIFSHVFKLLGLGPLIGTRTWGGVIGISARHRLVDGTVVTQPEYAFWFRDVYWAVENYGTDPDLVVDDSPADYAQGRDRQLERAIEVCLAEIEAKKPEVPKFGPRPSKRLPETLPPRR